MVATYTATADIEFLVSLRLSGILGGGYYSAYCTRQIGGAGVEFYYEPRLRTWITGTQAVLSSLICPLLKDDKLRVYVKGLAGDTVNPVITTEIWETAASATWHFLHGPGSTAWEITIVHHITGLPMEGVVVWITTDLAGTNVIYTGTTNTLGKVTPYLDPGNYYAWKQIAGYTFTNPELFSVI